jgi:hypothetical protein
MQTIFERDGPTIKEVEDALSICDAIPEWIGDGDKDYESFHVSEIRNCARVLKYFRDENERHAEQIRQMHLTDKNQAEAINWLYIEKEQLQEQLDELNKKNHSCMDGSDRTKNMIERWNE